MWRELPLSELAEISSGGTPSRDVSEFWGGAIPWATPTDISASSTNYLTRTKETISQKGLLGSSARLLPAGSILLTSRATIGEARIATMPVCTNQGFKNLTPKSNVDGHFLFYQVQRCRNSFERYAAGSTFAEINKRDTARVGILHPVATSQQKRIAAILTSLDTTIEKTEALIAKHQQIKAGLMHDLFTRGVLPNGKMRPPRSQAPQLYRESLVGWLPKEWRVDTLKALLAPIANNIRSGPFGSALLKNELVETGIPFLGIDNIHVERFTRNFKRFVSERKFRELSRYRVRPGDVVITIMGTVGRCCVIPDDLDVALSSKHLWTMTFDADQVIPELMCWQLNHAAWAKAWFRRCTQGGIMDAIQSSTLKTLAVPVPGMAEQQAIFQRYNAVQVQVASSHAQLGKLHQQKLGLMQDLLTGKVPVKVTHPGAPT